MFHRILIPIEGSPHGVDAVQAAVAIARRTSAQLIALYMEWCIVTSGEATAQTAHEYPWTGPAHAVHTWNRSI